MSADNGIYILTTLKDDSIEYRVAHLQAVDNIYWDDKIKKETFDDDVMIKNAREMWIDFKYFKSKKKAIDYAIKLHDKIGYVEYGISFIEIDREF